ncbi:tellurite resistance TerB family protein [Bosea massiliensis]|uniref:Tellurite resistance TerB family protein n=1 Tax=Bosea massiliensis TaxID=151419 RepID=A0ABW0P575_9HYPH
MFNAKSLLDALVSAGTQAGKPGGQGQTGSLGQILGGLAGKVQQGGGLGGLAGMAGQILTQASQGVGDAARQTGVQQKAGDVVGQVTGGRSAQDVLAQAKAMFDKNPAMATAVLGGLGALVFGTSSGRAVIGSAARLGGMALIGGLAYKAYQNYQSGKPLLEVGNPELLPPPRGTGFESEAASEATALLFIRAMIAAAAADGAIDAEERTAILGGLREAGFDQEANEWLEGEMASPASIEALAQGAQSPEVAAQIYTAARIAINPDTPKEKDFLAGLAASLGLDAELVANIDVAASAAKA